MSEKKHRSPANREKQMQALAMDLAEKQLRDGTASSAVIVHFLKASSSKTEIEKELLAGQSKLTNAKAAAIAKESENSSSAKEAIEALKGYRSRED